VWIIVKWTGFFPLLLSWFHKVLVTKPKSFSVVMQWFTVQKFHSTRFFSAAQARQNVSFKPLWETYEVSACRASSSDVCDGDIQIMSSIYLRKRSASHSTPAIVCIGCNHRIVCQWNRVITTDSNSVSSGYNWSPLGDNIVMTNFVQSTMIWRVFVLKMECLFQVHRRALVSLKTNKKYFAEKQCKSFWCEKN